MLPRVGHASRAEESAHKTSRKHKKCHYCGKRLDRKTKKDRRSFLLEDGSMSGRVCRKCYELRKKNESKSCVESSSSVLESDHWTPAKKRRNATRVTMDESSHILSEPSPSHSCESLNRNHVISDEDCRKLVERLSCSPCCQKQAKLIALLPPRFQGWKADIQCECHLSHRVSLVEEDLYNGVNISVEDSALPTRHANELFFLHQTLAVLNTPYMGYTAYSDFLSILGFKHISHTTFYRYYETVLRSLETVANKSFDKVIDLLHEVFLPNGQMKQPPDGIPPEFTMLSISMDGSWSHPRNAGQHAYTIRISAPHAPQVHKKILYQVVLHKSRTRNGVLVHQGNYDGSSKSMEAHAFEVATNYLLGAGLLEDADSKHALVPKIRSIVSDQDCAILKNVNTEQIFKNVSVFFDLGHQKKNLKKRLDATFGGNACFQGYSVIVSKLFVRIVKISTNLKDLLLHQRVELARQKVEQLAAHFLPGPCPTDCLCQVEDQFTPPKEGKVNYYIKIQAPSPYNYGSKTYDKYRAIAKAFFSTMKQLADSISHFIHPFNTCANEGLHSARLPVADKNREWWASYSGRCSLVVARANLGYCKLVQSLMTDLGFSLASDVRCKWAMEYAVQKDLKVEMNRLRKTSPEYKQQDFIRQMAKFKHSLMSPVIHTIEYVGDGRAYANREMQTFPTSSNLSQHLPAPLTSVYTTQSASSQLLETISKKESSMTFHQFLPEGYPEWDEDLSHPLPVPPKPTKRPNSSSKDLVKPAHSRKSKRPVASLEYSWQEPVPYLSNPQSLQSLPASLETISKSSKEHISAQGAIAGPSAQKPDHCLGCGDDLSKWDSSFQPGPECYACLQSPTLIRHMSWKDETYRFGPSGVKASRANRKFLGVSL